MKLFKVNNENITPVSCDTDIWKEKYEKRKIKWNN
jgi:hypothetical protein